MEDEATVEPEEVATTESELEAGEAEADEEAALLSPPVVVVGADDSVVRDTDVVDESVMMTASVLDDASAVGVVGAATVVLSALLSCRFRSSARTATSCFAISMRREASDGLSLWMCSMARWSCSKTPA